MCVRICFARDEKQNWFVVGALHIFCMVVCWLNTLLNITIGIINAPKTAEWAAKHNATQTHFSELWWQLVHALQACMYTCTDNAQHYWRVHGMRSMSCRQVFMALSSFYPRLTVDRFVQHPYYTHTDFSTVRRLRYGIDNLHVAISYPFRCETLHSTRLLTVF